MATSSVITQLRTTNLGQSIRFYTEKGRPDARFQYEDFLRRHPGGAISSST